MRSFNSPESCFVFYSNLFFKILFAEDYQKGLRGKLDKAVSLHIGQASDDDDNTIFKSLSIKKNEENLRFLAKREELRHFSLPTVLQLAKTLQAYTEEGKKKTYAGVYMIRRTSK